jgi:threonine dehydrogenase-like Zn-dependent dehydrogenase
MSEILGHPFSKNAQDSGPNLGGEAVKVQHSGVTVTSNKDEAARMKAVIWHGKKDMRVVDRPRPLVTDPTDVVLKVTSSAICGSDLHFYLGAMVGMQSGDIVGHEFMGEVVQTGPEVKNLQKGDRVVVCFDIGCGSCFFCKQQHFSGCDNTNPSQDQAKLYSDRTAGLFGYSHMTGGWEGGQAQYVRVPFADVNALKVPSNLPDDKVVLLSDILPTGWHATECGKVGEGDRVAIWGAGPVGILAAQCAHVRGASEVVLIDCQPDRLDFAKEKMPYVKTINFKDGDVHDQLHQILGETGPDVCLECVGFHYAKTKLHKLEMLMMLETDPSDILNELIRCCRKGGRIGVVGVYAGYCNHFNIGAFMEKGLSMSAGQTPVQKYWHHLLDLVKEGKLTPDMVITHHLPIDDAPKGYKMFNDKEDGCIKVVLKPNAAESA